MPSGRSLAQTLAGPITRVFEKTSEIMPAVI